MRLVSADCSHLVHAIYLQAGFPYPYASSSDLYDGTDDFRRVNRPQPGDLVVWPVMWVSWSIRHSTSSSAG